LHNRGAVVNNNQNIFWGDNNACVNTHYHFHEHYIIHGDKELNSNEEKTINLVDL